MLRTLVLLGFVALTLAEKNPCERVPKGLKDRIKDFVDDKGGKGGKAEDILAHADDLPEACVQHLADKFKPDSCNETTARCTMRHKRGSPMFAKAVAKCLSKDKVCPFFKQLINDTDSFVDISPSNFPGLGEVIEKEKCDVDDLPVARLLLLPKKLIQKRLDNFDEMMMKHLLQELITEGALLERIPCDHLKLIMKKASELINIMGLKGDEMKMFLKLASIFPEEMCNQISDLVVTSIGLGMMDLADVLQYLAKQPFECRGEKAPSPHLEKLHEYLECFGDDSDMTMEDEMGEERGRDECRDFGPKPKSGERPGGDSGPDKDGGRGGKDGGEPGGEGGQGGESGKGGEAGKGGEGGDKDSKEKGNKGSGERKPKLGCRSAMGSGGRSKPKSDMGGERPDGGDGGDMDGGTGGEVGMMDDDEEDMDWNMTDSESEALKQTLKVWGPPKLCGFKCGEQFVKKLVDNGLLNLTRGDGKGLGNLRPCLPEDAVLDSLKPGKCGVKDVGPIPGGPKDRAEAAKKCKPPKDFDEMSRDDIKGFGCSLPFLKRKDLEKMEKQELCAVIKDLADCVDDMPNSFKREVGHLCHDPPPELRGYQGPGALKNMTDEDLDEVLPEVVETLEKRGQKKQRGWMAASKIVLKWVSPNQLEDNKEMLKLIPFNVIPESDVTGLGNGGPYKLRLLVMAKTLKAIAAQNMTVEDLSELGCGVTGSTGKEIKDMGSEDHLSIVKQLCSCKQWNNEQGEAIKEKLVEGLDIFDGENPAEQLTETDVDVLDARCLIHLHSSFIKKTTKAVRKRILAKVAKAEFLRCLVNKKKRRRLAELALEVWEIKKDSMTRENMENLGKLLMDVDTEDEAKDKTRTIFSKIDKCEMKKILAHHGRVGLLDMTPEEREVAIDRVCEAFRECHDTNQTMPSTYDLLCMEELTQEEIEERLTEMQADRELEVESERESEDSCLRAERDPSRFDEDMKKYDRNRNKIILEGEQAKRRRRETTSLDCTSLQVSGECMESMTVDQLSLITQDSYTNCIFEIGNRKWSDEQRASLYGVFKQVVGGNVCQASESHLSDVGTVAYEMSVSDIGCLTNLGEDAMANLGALSMWSPDKLEALAKKFMEKMGINEASALTSDHIAIMGHALCGLTPDQIEAIDGDEFGDAVTYVGLLEWCPLVQLKAIASHAIDLYGPVREWESYHFVEAGIILGGLSGDDLKNADEDAIDGWTMTGIKHLPGSELKKLAAEKLKSLNMDQARAVTSDAQKQLSTAQKNAILEARSGGDGSDADKVKEDDKDPSAASVNAVNTLLAILLLALAQLY